MKSETAEHSAKSARRASDAGRSVGDVERRRLAVVDGVA
jgi:hypothetical protein